MGSTSIRSDAAGQCSAAAKRRNSARISPRRARLEVFSSIWNRYSFFKRATAAGAGPNTFTPSGAGWSRRPRAPLRVSASSSRPARTTPVIDAQSLAANYTNEVGVSGKIRFLKNIAGLWLLQEYRKAGMAEGREYSYEHLTRLAREERPFAAAID